MKKIYISLLIIVSILVCFYRIGLVKKESQFVSLGLSTYLTTQGGTGTTTPSGILYGDNGATGSLKTVTIGSGCTFVAGTLSCPGTTFPFTSQSWGNSTSTTLGFLNGFLSTASSTISSALRLSSLGQGFLFTGSNGLVQPIASSSVRLSWFNNDAGFITSAVTSVTGTYPIVSSGGNTPNITFSGLGTTSPWTTGNLAMVSSNNAVTSVSTTTLVAGSNISFGGATPVILGSSPITISATGGSGSVSTSTVDWIVYNDGGTTKVYDTIAGNVPTSGTFSAVMNWIVNKSTSTNPARVNTQVRSGTYTCDSSIIINGGSSRFGPNLIFTGNASSTTILVQTPKCFDFRNQATVNISHVAAAFPAGSNTMFYASSTAGSSVQSSLRESIFEDINGFSTSTGHTGYLFDLVGDFRNNYTHIMCDQCGNMWRSTNNYTNAQFINGDSNVYGFSFCELNNSGTGVCWDINGNKGVVNQLIFNDINGISNDSGVGTNDIFFRCTGTFGCSRIVAKGLNVEQFATTTQIGAGNGVYIESSKYITPTDGVATAAVFEASASAFNVGFQCKEVEVSAATTILYDKNTLKTQPNSLQGVNGANCIISDNGGSMRFATSTASIVRDVYDNVAGATWLSAIKVLGDKIVTNFSEAATDWISSVGSKMSFVVGGSERMSIADSGFGTTTVTGFTVNGSATSTSNVGFNISTGCYAINNVCVSGAGGGVTSVIAGVGFLNRGLNITSSGTLNVGIATSTNPTIGQIPYWAATGDTTNPATLSSVATSTPTIGAALSYTGTMGNVIGGSSGTLSLNMGNANSWTALQTFANSSTTYGSFITSSSTDAYFGTGQGIAYVGSNGRLRTTATSTFALSGFTNDLANLTATNATLTFSGSYNGSAARTVGLNLGNANTWTALQTFNYSSTTGQATFANASSTQWVGGGLTSCSNAVSSKLLYNSTTGQFSCGTDQTGSGGTPAGSDSEIQYNNAGSFGAVSTTNFAARYLAGANPSWLFGTSSNQTARVEINNQLTTYTRGQLAIYSDTNSGADYEIKLVSRNPDIEFVDVDSSGYSETSGNGQFEIDVNNDMLRFNLRNSANDSFIPGVNFVPTSNRNGIKVGIGTEYDSANAVLSVVATSSETAVLNLSSYTNHAAGTNTGDLFTVLTGGKTGVGSTTPFATLSIGSSNTGTLAISTTTDGCPQFTKGLLWIGTCAGGGSVTSVVAGVGFQNRGLNITGSGTLNVGIATSTNPSISGLAMWTATGDASNPATLGSISTSTLVNNIFPFTSYGASTSTIFGFTGGMFASASSTFSSALRLPSLSQGALYIGSTGLVQTVSTSTPTFGSSLSYTGTAGQFLGGSSGTLSLNTANANTWSALQTFNYSSSTAYSSFLTASSTNLFTGFLTLSTSTAGTLKVASNGVVWSDTSASSGGYATIQDEGSGLTARTILNFTGSGVNCVDNSGSSRTDCTINAGAATAGGSNKQVQFNDSTALGGASGLEWDKSNGELSLASGNTLILGATATSSTSQLEVIKNGILGWFASTTGAFIRPVLSIFHNPTTGISGIGINSSSTEDTLTINGRTNLDPQLLGCGLMGQGGSITTDQLAGQVCDWIAFDSITDGRITQTSIGQGADEAGMPMYTRMEAGNTTSYASNEGAWLKTQRGMSATTTLVSELWIRNPSTTNFGTTTTTLVFGHGNPGQGSQTTTAAYAVPTNACIFTSSSTANWIAATRRGSVWTDWDDTGIATSTTASTFRRFRIVQDYVNGCQYYVDGVLVGSASAASSPTTPLQVYWGLGNNTAGVGNIGNHLLEFAEQKIWWGRWQPK